VNRKLSSSPKKLVVCSVVFLCLIEIGLWFFARTPRGRLNVTQIVSVLFLAIVIFRFREIRAKRDQAPASPPGSESMLLPYLAILLGTLVWTTMLSAYFISDDFGLLYMARTPMLSLMWSVFRYGDGAVFYRPLTLMSFSWDHAIWGEWPVGYHVTNLLLHAASVAGLFVLLRQLGARWRVSAMAAGLFAAMPIQVESVAWMSGRFDVLSTTIILWTTVCYLWARAKNSVAGYFAALVLFVLSMCSKETGFVLPLLLIAIELAVFRARPPWKIVGFLAIGGVAFVYRLFALGGLGGYKSGGVSSALDLGPKTLEGLLIRAPAQMLFGLNWTEPVGILAITVASVIAAILMLLVLGARLGTEQHSIVQLALIWTFITMIPAHFLLMIGPGLSNSRVLCLPTVGIAMMLGQLLGSLSGRRFQTAVFAVFAVVLNLGVLHNLAAWRSTAALAEDTLQHVMRLEPSPPSHSQLVFSNLPDTVRGVFFFRVGLSESLKMAYGRDDISAIHDSDPATEVPGSPQVQVRFLWKGEPEELLVKRRRD